MSKQLMVRESIPAIEFDTYQMLQNIPGITDAQAVAFFYIFMSSKIASMQAELFKIRSVMVTKDELKETKSASATKADLEKAISRLEIKIADTKSDLEAKIADIQNRLSVLEAKVADIQSRLSALEAKVADIQSRLSKLEAKVDSMKSELEAKIDGIKSELEAKIVSSMNELLKEGRKRDDRLYKTLITTAILIVMILGILIKF